jgi:3-deoxy-D-manno-octulosonic-acid transferase
MDMVPTFFYNLLLTVGVIVFAPLLFVKVILTPKYRSRSAKRLGFALGERPGGSGADRPRIWVHALSVGEVASARNLVQELRRNYPQGILVFSSATRAGESFARSILGEDVDCFVPFPFDLLWSVKRLVSWVRPDLFVLVETDFWPNFQRELNRRGIPSLLVNGRVSAGSLASYRRFRWLFKPLFNSFQALAMQTEQDAISMRQLGVDPARLAVLGNLKYDAALSGSSAKAGLDRTALHIPAQALVWVAGSTHRGEEEIIFAVFQKLSQSFADLFLVVAPRNVERGGELAGTGLSPFAVRLAEQGRVRCWFSIPWENWPRYTLSVMWPLSAAVWCPSGAITRWSPRCMESRYCSGRAWRILPRSAAIFWRWAGRGRFAMPKSFAPGFPCC